MKAALTLICLLMTEAAYGAECDIDTSGLPFRVALANDVGHLGIAYACEPRVGSLPRTVGRYMLEETLRAAGMNSNDAVIDADRLERKAQAEAQSLTTEQILERRWDEREVCMRYLEEGQRDHRVNLAKLRKAMCQP